MFKVIRKDDVKIFKNSLFIKNANFFKDEIAFFDAYSDLCEKTKDEIPSYCMYQNGAICLDGVCFLFKTYASELGFNTLDLSIDYLKTLYYSIATLSKDGETVDRDLVINEYLIYKEVNKNQYSKINKTWQAVQNKHFENVKNFETLNKKQAKYALASKVLNILAFVSIILAVIVAIVPSALYFAQKIVLKSAIIYIVATILIGLILRFEFKLFAKHFYSIAMDDAYSLQALKKTKDESQKIYEELKIKNCKFVCSIYDYEQNLDDSIFVNKLSFDKILNKAKKQSFRSFNLKNDIAKFDENQRELAFEILDKIAAVQLGNDARLENIYNEIYKEDSLYFNNLVRLRFLDKFIENAKVSNCWGVGGSINPFGMVAKNIATEKITYYDAKNDACLSMNLDVFFQTKLANSIKKSELKSAKNEETMELLKFDYINSFCKNKNDESLENIKIPTLLSIKLAILKSRLVCNSLGETVFLKLKEIIKVYESKFVDDEVETESEFISEKTETNLTMLKLLNECDDVIDIGNDEVICVIDGKKIKGFKFSNI